MSDTRTISPAPDRRVRHEDGRLLEPGTAVTWSTYWQRRLDDGDIVLADTTTRPPREKKAAKSEEQSA